MASLTTTNKLNKARDIMEMEQPKDNMVQATNAFNFGVNYSPFEEATVTMTFDYITMSYNHLYLGLLKTACDKSKHKPQLWTQVTTFFKSTGPTLIPVSI